MHINLSKFKKVRSDQHTTTLKHQDGHEIKIAHRALSPKLRGQLQQIEAIEAPKENQRTAQAEMKPVKMADGGEVEDKKKNIDEAVADAAEQAKQSPVTINIQQPGVAGPTGLPEAVSDAPAGVSDAPAGVSAATGLPSEADPTAAQVGPQGAPSSPDKAPSSAPDAMAAAQMTPPAQAGLGEGRSLSGEGPATPSGAAPQASGQDPFGTMATQGAYEQGLKERKSGIFGEAAALAQSAQAQQAALDKAADMQMNAQQLYQKHYSELETERAHLQEDLKNQHIDPEHYFHSMDVPQKISTAIGLILGGFGAAQSGRNMAVEYVQKQIENDIGAQKANLGKTESLLNANMKQFGNLKDATDMTRVMQMDMVSNQLKKAALTATDMQAKAKALQAAGEIDMQAAPIIGQMAMRKSLLTGMKNGQVQPERIVNALVPEHQRPEATKELKEAQAMVSVKDRLLQAYDDVAKLNTVGNRLSSPLQSKRQIDAIKGAVIPSLSKDTAGRYTESDAKALNELFSKVGNDDETVTKNRQQLVRLVQEKMHFPTLEYYGIRMGETGRFNSAGESRFSESAPVLKKTR